ncbi:MAG: ABC transporter ATP-binding protein, partial [Firmicutes bacterium]|nr:ABC transporter ATP-binding protein [Bacillota bacterium]
GILLADEGEITIGGVDIRKDPIEAKRQIGYVPDNHSMYDRLSGREYINFMADVFGVSKSERAERADRLLQIMNLTADVDNLIRSYSHGMKQKICVIGALIHNPKVWILDEPLTGLDPQSSFELKKMMREHADGGNLVFFSTHILEVAEKICDRLGIINKGRLLADGTLDEFKAAHSNESLEAYFLRVTDSQ